jgi:hypothetical protein
MTDLRAAIAAVRLDGEVWTARSPQSVAQIGGAIAASLRESAPAAIACWIGDDESVLAHAIAVQLDIPVLRVVEDLGLLSIEGEASPGSRVALVATRWDSRRPPAPLAGALRHACLEPVALASVLTARAQIDEALPMIVAEEA